jgi:hypothetical protein
MKRVIISGFIAGVTSSIVLVLFAISGLYELFSITSHIPPINLETIVQVEIISGVVWGIIWAGFYAFFYNYIPSKGVKKGIIYALMIWIISGFREAVVAIPYGYHMWTIPYTIATFFSITITFGLLIGFLYKKE